MKTMWLLISWEFCSLNPFVSLELTAGGLGVLHVGCVHTHVPGEVARGAVGDFGQNMAVAIFGHAEAAQTAAFEFFACLCHVGRVRQHSSAVSRDGGCPIRFGPYAPCPRIVPQNAWPWAVPKPSLDPPRPQ